MKCFTSLVPQSICFALIYRWEGGVRVVAVVWSHLIESPTRVSNGLYHVTDWLPTLYRLAGGTGFLQPNDGMDIWNSISTGAPSPRTEVLLQADTIWGEYALRWRQYKLVLGSWKGVQKPLDQWFVLSLTQKFHLS